MTAAAGLPLPTRPIEPKPRDPDRPQLWVVHDCREGELKDFTAGFFIVHRGDVVGAQASLAGLVGQPLSHWAERWEMQGRFHAFVHDELEWAP